MVQKEAPVTILTLSFSFRGPSMQSVQMGATLLPERACRLPPLELEPEIWLEALTMVAVQLTRGVQFQCSSPPLLTGSPRIPCGLGTGEPHSHYFKSRAVV